MVKICLTMKKHGEGLIGVDENASTIMLEGNIKDFIVVGIWNVAKIDLATIFQKIYNMLSNKDQKS